MTSRDEFLAGRPIEVDPARIDRELALLWKPQEPGEEDESDSETTAATRACLSNLVVFLANRASHEEASALLDELGRSHPSRTILVLADGEAGTPVQAAVTALCHRPARQAPPVCCERILLRCTLDDLEVAAGCVRSLLVPDVTTTLLLDSTETAWDHGLRMAYSLRRVVDQAAFDSRLRPASSLQRIRRLIDSRQGRSIRSVHDMAWYELRPWREFLADIFDDRLLQPVLHALARGEIEYVGESTVESVGSSSAALFGGWLVSRLGDKLDVHLSGRRESSSRSGALLAVTLEADDGSLLRLERTPGVDSLRVSGTTPKACVLPRLRFFRHASDAVLLGRALERRESASVFLQALESACSLIERR